MGNRIQEEVIVGVTQTFDDIDQSGERPRTGTRWFGGIEYRRLSVPGLQLMMDLSLSHPSPVLSLGCVRRQCLMSDEVGWTLDCGGIDRREEGRANGLKGGRECTGTADGG